MWPTSECSAGCRNVGRSSWVEEKGKFGKLKKEQNRVQEGLDSETETAHYFASGQIYYSCTPKDSPPNHSMKDYHALSLHQTYIPSLQVTIRSSTHDSWIDFTDYPYLMLRLPLTQRAPQDRAKIWSQPTASWWRTQPLEPDSSTITEFVTLCVLFTLSVPQCVLICKAGMTSRTSFLWGLMKMMHVKSLAQTQHTSNTQQGSSLLPTLGVGRALQEHSRSWAKMYLIHSEGASYNIEKM